MKHYSRLILAALTIMMVVPAQAQYRGYNSRYGRTTYNRPASRNYSYSAPYTYYGFRVGLNGATVNSDDKFLDGGSMQSGLNVGFNVGVLLTQTAPLFFETGLQYTEKGGKGNLLRRGLLMSSAPPMASCSGLSPRRYAKPSGCLSGKRKRAKRMMETFDLKQTKVHRTLEGTLIEVACSIRP